MALVTFLEFALNLLTQRNPVEARPRWGILYRPAVRAGVHARVRVHRESRHLLSVQRLASSE